MMMKTITLSHPHILFFFLLSSAVHAKLDRRRPASYPKFSRILNWDPLFTPVVAAIGCSFLFVVFFSIYVRYCSVARHQVASRGPTTGTAAAATHCSSPTSQGIDPKLLNTFPILAYSGIKHLRLDDSTELECAVCLSEFDHHHDSLRLLPICNHVFHPQCIDAWLESHVTCPVCRTRMTPPMNSHGGDKDDDFVIVIPEEVSRQHETDESSESRREEFNNSGERRSLRRFHSTGHSLSSFETVGKDMERYTLRLSEDVRKQIMANHGGMRRSASYDVFGPGRRPDEVKCQKF